MSKRMGQEFVRRLIGVIGVAALVGAAFGCSASAPAGPTASFVAPPSAFTAAGTYTVTAGTSTVAPGGDLSVSWIASVGQRGDWIGLFRVGDPNAFDLWAMSTEGQQSGTLTLSAPSQKGQYEFRYLLEQFEQDVARSGLVTVGQ
jgi:hypothetical protein